MTDKAATFAANIRLVHHEVNKFLRGRIGWQFLKEDLLQAGALAMWRSLETYDEARGKLSTYVLPAVRWALWEEVAKQTVIVRATARKGGRKLPLREQPETVPFGCAVGEDGQPIDEENLLRVDGTPEDNANAGEAVALVRAAAARVCRRRLEWLVLRMRLLAEHPFLQEDVARIAGVSRQAVSESERNLTRRLVAELRRRFRRGGSDASGDLRCAGAHRAHVVRRVVR